MKSRTHRTLSVRSSAIPQHMGHLALEPIRLKGREGVNRLFEYELLLQSPEDLFYGSADLNLDDFNGREISCLIELDGAGQFIAGVAGASQAGLGAGVREINALITDAVFWGEEGRHRQYKLMLRPWLHLATLSANCRVFQNKTVVQVLDELLGGYIFPVEKRLYEHYRLEEYQVQFNETDFECFERLCQEWGISYHFEHDKGAHRLVLSDAAAAFRPNPSEAYRTVDYHAPGWKVDAEYLHSFAPVHQLTSGSYSTTDYDYTRPRANLRQTRRDPRPTAHAGGEIYQWHDARGGAHFAKPNAGNCAPNDPNEEGRQLAMLRMQALRTQGERASASGNLRGVCAGATFKLKDHPRQSANAEYLVLDANFLIEDIGQNSQLAQQGANQGQRWRVQLELELHPVAEPLRPALVRPKPLTYGPQTAVVVGPEGQNIWTDELGRIKVQFPWDRLGQNNEHSSCWVRVSSPWAGNQLGGIHIPRIGQEVLIDFIGGDPDLPICTGRVHKVIAQAQHNGVEITAQKEISITSSEDEIVLKAKKAITFVLEDGTYVRLADGKVVCGMRGQFNVKSAGRLFEGPATLPADLPSFYVVEQAQELKLHREAGKHMPVADREFQIVTGSRGKQLERSGADALSKLKPGDSFDVGR